MAEFKITQDLDAEVSSFALGGQEINQSFAAATLDGVDTLATAKAFVEEQKKLKELLALYATLVNKDAQDLDRVEFVLCWKNWMGWGLCCVELSLSVVSNSL